MKISRRRFFGLLPAAGAAVAAGGLVKAVAGREYKHVEYARGFTTTRPDQLWPGIKDFWDKEYETYSATWPDWRKLYGGGNG